MSIISSLENLYSKLTLEELDKIASLSYSQGKLCETNAFVQQRLLKLLPGIDVDIASNKEAMRAYLNVLEGYVQTLPPVYVDHRLTVAYHQLQWIHQHTRTDSGVSALKDCFDKLLTYVQLPREGTFTSVSSPPVPAVILTQSSNAFLNSMSTY